ncbi:MAG: helix-turn-helix domain-containing protein [Bacillota bacterium]|nr:transcriptional regulator [Bacillota bacterium]REJ37327.1 MAG: transcriptional regulator [Bacillota bacterium]
MDLIRIGDKLISRRKIQRAIDRILERRAQGLSQQDVAAEMGIDRAFVSHLERLGEVRRGRRIALIGFPVKNKDELEALAREEGVDFVLLLNNAERWSYVEGVSGAELFNRVMEIIARIRECDQIVFLGSDMRIRWMESVLGTDRVIGIELGPSPITEDRYVPPERVRDVLAQGRG